MCSIDERSLDDISGSLMLATLAVDILGGHLLLGEGRVCDALVRQGAYTLIDRAWRALGTVPAVARSR